MKKLLTLLFALFIPSTSYAANFSCQGKVSTLALSPVGGTLQVNAGHGVHYLCTFHAEYNGVHPEICKAWYSMFLTAKIAGKEIKQYYSQTTGGAQNCSELGTWTDPNPMPYFVEILD